MTHLASLRPAGTVAAFAALLLVAFAAGATRAPTRPAPAASAASAPKAAPDAKARANPDTRPHAEAHAKARTKAPTKPMAVEMRSDPRSDDASLAKAVALRESGHPDDALYLLDQALGSLPDRPGGFRVERARVMLALDRIDEASTDLDDAIATGADPDPVRLVRADLFTARGQFADAIASCEQVPASSKLHAAALLKKARLLDRGGRGDEVPAVIDAAARAGAGRAALAVARGRHAIDTGHAKESLELFATALDAAGADAAVASAAHAGRADAFTALDDTDAALGELARAYELGTADGLKRDVALGIVELDGGRWDAASERLARAARDAATDPTLWFLLGEAESGRRHRLDAATAFGHVVALRPGYVVARLAQAEELLLGDRPAQADDALDPVLAHDPSELRPDSGVDVMRMGRVAFLLGRYPEARRWLAHGLAKAHAPAGAAPAAAAAAPGAGAAPKAPSMADLYANVMLYLARVAGGDAENARVDLARVQAPASQPWFGGLVDYFSGRIDEHALREAAAAGKDDRERAERACEADFYVTVDQLARGRPFAGARPVLERAVATCPADFIEGHGAVALLWRKGAATPAK